MQTPYIQETLEERITYYETIIRDTQERINLRDPEDKMLIKLDNIALATNLLYLQMLLREKYARDLNISDDLEAKIVASGAELQRLKDFLNNYIPCGDATTDKTAIAWTQQKIEKEEKYLFELIQSRKPLFSAIEINEFLDREEPLEQQITKSQNKILELEQKLIEYPLTLSESSDFLALSALIEGTKTAINTEREYLIELLNQQKYNLELLGETILAETDKIINKSKEMVAEKELTRAQLKQQTREKLELSENATLADFETATGFKRKLWDYRKKDTWIAMLNSYQFDIEDLAEGGITEEITQLMPFLESQGFSYQTWNESCDDNGYFITIDDEKYTIYEAKDIETIDLWSITFKNFTNLINQLLLKSGSEYKFILIRGSEETLAFAKPGDYIWTNR